MSFTSLAAIALLSTATAAAAAEPVAKPDAASQIQAIEVSSEHGSEPSFTLSRGDENASEAAQTPVAAGQQADAPATATVEDSESTPSADAGRSAAR